MAEKKRRPATQHAAGETEPCEECVAELRLEGRGLVEGVLDSLHQEEEVEEMWRPARGRADRSLAYGRKVGATPMSKS